MENNNFISDDPEIPKNAKKIITDAVIKQVAALAVTGMGQNKIATALSISLRQVRYAFEDERFKALVEDIGDDAILASKTYLRHEISKMSKMMIESLRNNLKKDSLEAVKIGLKVIGLDQVETEQPTSNNLTVIMANADNPEKVIEVKPKKLGDVN